MKHSPDETQLHGVQELLEALRDKGVKAGQDEAQRIVDEAQHRAQWIVEQAREEANHICEQAQKEADNTLQAGREALELAARDTLLKFKEQLTAQLRQGFKRCVSAKLSETDMLAKIILEIAGRAPHAHGKSKIYLQASSKAQSRNKDTVMDVKEEPLDELIAAQLRDLLQDDVELLCEEHGDPGITLSMQDSEVIVEINDKVINDILLSFLQPRFRALLDGVGL